MATSTKPSLWRVFWCMVIHAGHDPEYIGNARFRCLRCGRVWKSGN